MKRCFKKAVAFGLALSMFVGCMVVSAEENEGNGIAVIEDAVYDEAVSFLDTVVLLENGHWAKRVKDEVTGERVPYTDVTAETNIVFIDGEGNKKVISNKDANGEMIFDAVLPEITNLDSNDYICVFKGEKQAYISPEGEFFGESLKFYKDVQYVSDEYLWVSEDGINYDLINKAGEIVCHVDNAQDRRLFDNTFYYTDSEKAVAVNLSDKSIIKEYSGTYRLTNLNGEYIQLISDNEILILNSKAEEKLRFDAKEVRYCNSVAFGTGYVKVVRYREDGSATCEIMNIETGNSIGVFEAFPECTEDGFILDSKGKVFTNIDGSVRIDLSKYEETMRNEMIGYNINADFYYEAGILYSKIRTTNDEDAVTYIIKSEDGYKTSEMVKVKGLITAIDEEKDRYILTNGASIVYGLYDFNGKLIKDFNEYPNDSYKSYGYLFSFMDNIVTNAYVTVGGRSNNVFIKTDGSLIGPYETVKDHGNFIFGGTADGKLEIVNKKAKVVFSEKGLYEPIPADSSPYVMKFIRNAYGFKNKEYFAVIRDGICSLYDINGNEVELGDTYSGIGPCGGISGSYGSAGYNYENEDLANGLCVTRKTDAEGNHKYGVIKFNVTLEKGDCNGDKLINAQDALAVLKHVAKITILPDESVGEVTGDGLVNAQDALEILKFAAHIIDGFGKNSEDVVIPTMIPESDPTPVPAGPITYDKESDTYTMHGNGMAYVEGQKVPNGYYELKNPFSGLDLNEGLVINEFDRPVWNKGVTISFWVKVPTTEVDSEKDAVVMTFSLPEHIVVDENGLMDYYLCKGYSENDEAYSMGTAEIYVAIAEDGTETEYTVLNGYGNNVRYNPNYPEEGCYSLKTDNDAVYAIKKGTDPMLEENWVPIGFIGESLCDDYSKRYFEEGGENSKITEVNTTARLNIFASGSVEFMEDDGTGYQLNPSAEDYLKSHKATNNNKYGMQANNNPANGFSLSNNPTPDTVTKYDQWRFMVVTIANDGVTVYSDGEKIIEECYSYCGTAMKDAYKIFENSFNKGYGPRFSMINWGHSREKLDGLTLMELISDENTILEIGGQTNDYGRSINVGDKVINSIELVGTPEGTQVKNVKFYDTIVSEENIKADGIINENELIVDQIKTEVSL